MCFVNGCFRGIVVVLKFMLCDCVGSLEQFLEYCLLRVALCKFFNLSRRHR